MPNWHGIRDEIIKRGSVYDIVRDDYIKKLFNKRGRNVICYYSAFLQKGTGLPFVNINDNDKNGLMTVLTGLDFTKGLDLILHTPGGDTAATESIIDYLYKIFKGDISCFIPQIAMSGGTMIACSCKEIWMGKESSLGPIDPQFGALPAHAVIEEFERAKKEVSANPALIPIWQPIISKYHPTLVGECEKAIAWSKAIVKESLKRNMFKDDASKDEKIEVIIKELGDHAVNLSHARHISAEKCKEIKLNIKDLELDDDLQDLILSIHHTFMVTMDSTSAVKIIQNQESVSFVQIVTPTVIPQRVNQCLPEMESEMNKKTTPSKNPSTSDK